LPTLAHLAPDNDPAVGKSHFLPDLGMDIPPGLLQGGGDIFGADIAFGKGPFIHVLLMLQKSLNFRKSALKKKFARNC
jgi:hypothetical protein